MVSGPRVAPLPSPPRSAHLGVGRAYWRAIGYCGSSGRVERNAAGAWPLRDRPDPLELKLFPAEDIPALFNDMAGIGRLSTKGSVLLLCDMQEKFRPNIFQFANVVGNAARLLQASRVLGIPPIVTEQYPKGLGPTVPELGAGDLKAHAKTRFSMLTEEVEKELEALGNPKQAILCGIEAQACIACTTFDLLERGMEVHIVADAVSSRSHTDRLFALSRLKQSGAFLTTTEAVLLQLVQGAKHPNFKEIQKLLAHPSPDTGLLAFFSSL